MKAGEAVLPITSKQGSQKADLVCVKSAILLWYLPAFALIIGLNWAPARAWLWIPAFLVLGAACLVNAARCGRLHCFVTGPVYLLAAIYVALAAFALVTMRPNIFLLTVLGITICAFVAECPLGTYRNKSILTDPTPWAVGFHAGWDWGQSYFYGTPDSGLVVQNHLLASHP
jgi:hypothetical protein